MAPAEGQFSPSEPSHWQLLLDRPMVTEEVFKWKYAGEGTEESPYVVEWLPGDRRNPMLMPTWKKWLVTLTAASGTLSVSFASTAFSGAIPQIKEAFGVVDEVALLTVSLFVMGFAIGPMLWAPLSELYGKQYLWFCTLAVMTIFGGASLASKNVQTLIVLRAFAGAIGASTISNSAGVVSDIFTARERGVGVTLYSSAAFLGPTLGPIAGNFLAEKQGWFWVDVLTVLFNGAMWIVGTLLIPETYSPRLLIERANRLSWMTGKVYRSKLEVEKGRKKPSVVFRIAMTRPWIMFVREPIVLLLAVYMGIVYGTLYLIFSAFPIVFEQERHWSQGISGLSFVGNMTGQILAFLTYTLFFDQNYRRRLAANNNYLPPEARLMPALCGCVLLPAGLFWFAWTTYGNIFWLVCIIGSTIFGYGQVLTFLSLLNYLMDSYTIYAASTLAANAMCRSICATAFPLFTTYMYQNLGVQWASSVPAFMALACVPFPFVFFKFGPSIRSRCKYAGEAMRATAHLLAATNSKAQPAGPMTAVEPATTVSPAVPLARTSVEAGSRPSDATVEGRRSTAQTSQEQDDGSSGELFTGDVDERSNHGHELDPEKAEAGDMA